MQYYQPGFQPRDPAAFSWFCAVDANRSGNVDLHELQAALSNGGFTPFSRKTTHRLMNMFDNDRSGSLCYGEFEQLVGYLRSWQAQFQAASHGSGRLSHAHIPAVLAQLGYSFPPALALSIFQAYDDDLSGTLGFDEFIALLAEMYRLTAAFRAHDPSGTGAAHLPYATFMQLVFAARN